MRMVMKSLLLAVLVISLADVALAQQKPKIAALKESPKTVLYVGNSFFYFNNSLHSHVLFMIRNTDPQNAASHLATSVTISGSGLNWHNIDAYYNDGMASYTFDDNNNVVPIKREPKFDAVITMELAEAYTRAGNANDALVIPAGLAFERAIKRRPDINLTIVDRRHPSIAGTYLAASTIYASLYGRSPVGNAYRMGLDEATATFLQTVAWETVQAYTKE